LYQQIAAAKRICRRLRSGHIAR